MLDRPTLGGLHQVVDGALPLVGSTAHHHRAGQVGAVPVHLGAEIQEQEVSGADRALARPRMRQRGPWTGGHDGGKRVPLASAPPQSGLQRGPDLHLCLADPHSRQDLAQGVLGQHRCCPNGSHFLGRLDGTLTLHQFSGRHHPASGQSAQAFGISDGQRVGLDTQILRGASRQHAAEALPDAALVDLDHRYRPGLQGGLGSVAEIRYQNGGVLPDQQ